MKLTEVTNVIETDIESFKARQIWIDRYRDLERKVTDPLAALLVHDIVLELETRDGEPNPAACDPDAPTRTA
jgi:hypothetical protein